VLEQEGLIRLLPQRQRNIELIEQESIGIPLLGRIAAGKPIEAIENHDTLDFQSVLNDKCLFALEVKGDSMIEEGIFDGDKVICRSTSNAKENDIVVALLHEQEATLKRASFKKPGFVTLIPANANLKPMVYSLQEVRIQRIYAGLWRFF
jgi:repressor LexA